MLRSLFPDRADLQAGVESVDVMDGSVTIANSNTRFYASASDSHFSDFIVRSSDIASVGYARAQLLFQCCGWAFVYCSFFVPLQWEAALARTPAPSTDWRDSPLVTALELSEENPVCDVLPLDAILRPVPLIPMPLFDLFAEPGRHFPYWLHPHWADALLHASAAVSPDSAAATVQTSLVNAYIRRNELADDLEGDFARRGRSYHVTFADEQPARLPDEQDDDHEQEEDYFCE
jgi:hypothetical protein